MLEKILEERKLPDVLKMNDGTPVTAENWAARRAEIIEIFETMEYGRIPKTCGPTTAKVLESTECCDGCGVTHVVELTFPTLYGGDYSFVSVITIPTGASVTNPKPAVVFFTSNKDNKCSKEFVVKDDVILAECSIDQIAPDSDDNWATLLAPCFAKVGERKPDDPGKFSLWAFAASRILDYLLTLDVVDKTRVGVTGHSRLGKTALWAGAYDERFTHVFPINSGCSGVAITRGKEGENFPKIWDKFYYWFCDNMGTISGSIEDSESTNFDQHMLVAACAPRKFCTGAALQDGWADPKSAYLSCVAASPAWEINGMKGFVHPDRLPEAWDVFEDGECGYHLRDGGHSFKDYDWYKCLEFLKK